MKNRKLFLFLVLLGASNFHSISAGEISNSVFFLLGSFVIYESLIKECKREHKKQNDETPGIPTFLLLVTLFGIINVDQFLKR